MWIKDTINSLLFMTVALLWQACSTSYPGMYYVSDEIRDENEELHGNYYVLPSLKMLDVFYASSLQGTRGTGPFDYDRSPQLFKNKYMHSHFYVLAFRRTTMSSGPWSAPSDYRKTFLTDSVDCMIGAEKEINQHRGKVSVPKGLDGMLQFVSEEDDSIERDYFWSVANPTMGYDFYAYYLDDARINSVETTNDMITYNMSIDGTQDIMTGFAPVLTNRYLDMTAENLKKETKENIVYYGNGGYSTYSAHHGVQPIIDLKHVFARVRFNLFMYEDEIDPDGKRPQIIVTKVRIKSKSNIDLCVASREKEKIGIVNAKEEKWFEVKDSVRLKGDSIIVGDTLPPIEMQYGKVFPYGGSLLVVPEEEYFMEMDYRQYLVVSRVDPKHPVYDWVTRTAKIELSRDDDKPFEAGMSYVVTLRMYGAQRIETNVTIQPWIDGGEIGMEVIPME